MKYLIVNGTVRTNKDVLANCLALEDGFEYVTPYTTNSENSRIWNNPYVKADRMKVLMGENVPLVASYVNDDVYVYFENMMHEDAWNILILNDDGLKQLRENASDDTILTVRITRPCGCDSGCETQYYSDEEFDVLIEYNHFISDNAQAIKEFVKNV